GARSGMVGRRPEAQGRCRISSAIVVGPQRRLVVLVAASVVALDAATKAVAVHFLSGRGSVTVLGGAFHLELYRNFAGPHDTLEGHPVLVSLLAIAAVTVLALG